VRGHLQKHVGNDIFRDSPIEQPSAAIPCDVWIKTVVQQAEGRAVGPGSNDKLVVRRLFA
jgi:hypothetical protein